MKKRKLILWGLGLAAGVAGLGMLTLGIDMSRSARQYREFAKAHADAPRRVAELARFESPARMMASPVSGSRASRPSTALVNAATTQTAFVRAAAGICRDLAGVGTRYYKTYHTSLYAKLGDGMGAHCLLLSAADFPEEGSAGLHGGAALRRRILQETGEAFKEQVATRRERLREPVAAAVDSSGTLRRELVSVLDRTGRLLLSDEAGPDWGNKKDYPPSPLGMGTPLGRAQFAEIAALAVLRAGTRGQAGDAGRMLERLARTEIVDRIAGFPLCSDFWTVQKAALAGAESGGLTDASLARVAELLDRARLSEAQAADLRAAYMMRTDNRFLEESGDAQASNQKERGFVAKVAGLGARGFRSYLVSQMRLMGLAWASDDEAAYERAVRKMPLAILLPWRNYPSAVAAFRGRDATINDDVDLTRLVVAAARFRLAQGRYPERIEELVPRYLDSSDVTAGGTMLWGVDRLETTDPATSASMARPIFYLARRTALTKIRCIEQNFFYSVPEYTSMRSRTQRWQEEEKRSSGPVVNQQLYSIRELLSNEREDGIVVRIVWPRGEDIRRGWMDVLKDDQVTSAADLQGRNAEGQ